MKKLLTLFFTIAFISISLTSLTNGNGPGGGYTNAPSESVCSNSSCHGGTLNAGGSLANLKLEENFTGSGYIPDSTYTLRVRMSQSSINKWGFNITALYGSSNLPAGDFTNTSTRTQRRTKVISSQTRAYIEHASGGTSSTGTNSTDWVFSWKAPSSNVGPVKFYVSVNAANGNGASSGDDIYAKVFTYGASTLLPVAKAASNDTIICSGKTATMAGSGTNSPSTYSWIFPNGSPSISSDKNPTVNYNSPGNQLAILRVKNAKGWSDFDTLKIKVLDSPTAFVSGGDTRKMCVGGSLKLTAQFDSKHTYLWSNSKTGNEITVKDTGTYYVFVKSGACESVSNSVKVEFYGITKVNMTSTFTNDSICSGETVTLSSTSTHDSFYWFRNSDLLATTNANSLNLKIDSSGYYAVKVKDSNGCIGPFSDSVKYSAVVKENAPTVVCKNQGPFNVDFDWTGLLSHGGAQVSLNKGTTWLSPSSGQTGNYHSLTGLNPEEDYEVWVRGVLKQPCFYTNVTKAICRTGKCSPLEATIKADSMVCSGDELRIEINGLSKEKYALTFEGGGFFTDTIFSFTPSVEKSYTIGILDSSFLGCPAKKITFPVHIDKIETLRFGTQRPDNTFCTNDTIKFSASSGNDIYSFFVNSNLRLTTADSFYYESKFNDGDTAFVAVEKGACKQSSEKVTLSVVPIPEANFTFIATGSQYAFKPKINIYKSYFWEFGDGFTSVLKEPVHSYLASSNQTVDVKLFVTDNSNCLANQSQQIQLPDFSSISDLANNQIKIYPSPANNILYVEWLNEVQAPSNIKIVTLNGNVVLETLSSLNKVALDLSKVPSGMYIIEVNTTIGTLVKRLIKL